MAPIGTDVEPTFVATSRSVPVAHYATMVKVELVCPDEQAFVYADIVREQAVTADRRDGVFVSAVLDAIHIRNGGRGEDVVR